MVGNNRNLCTKPSTFPHTKRLVFSLNIKIIYPVNPGVYSALYMIISNIAIALCFIPFLLLFSKKMRQVKAYRVIGIYWLFNGLVNFINLDNLPGFRDIAAQEKLIFYYNLLDTPLVLFLFACAVSGFHRKVLLFSLLFFIAGELILVGWKGYTFLSSAMIIGAGLLLILAYSITGLVQYMKKMEHTPFENSMAFVYAALLFAYGSFLIIYIFIHVRGNAEGSRDSFMLYYISILLSAAITTMGLWSYGLRPQPRLDR